MEFKDAMKIADRMCDYYGDGKCGDCPYTPKNNNTNQGCIAFTHKYPEEAEKLLIQWDKDHLVETNLQHYEKVVESIIKETFSDENKSTGLCTPYKMPITFCNNGDSCKKCTEWWNSPYRKEKQNEAD